jgi:penicillin-binding protein 1C
VGVWGGNACGAPLWDVSGTRGAAPIWAELMGFLHRREASRAPAPPPGLVRMRVRFGDKLEAARDEWFIAGTEQARFELPAASSVEQAPRITAPADGTIIALDPDIPPRHQRVRFEAEGSGLAWQIDGKLFARGASAQWLPWPGRHVVELLDARGQVVDQLRLEVRGAGVKRVAAK